MIQSPPSEVQQQQEKVGVLLLNLGGPETLDDVQPFLYNLFNDDSIIRLPQQSKHPCPHLFLVVLMDWTLQTDIAFKL